MGDILTQLNIGAVVVPVSGVRPQSSTGGTIAGTSIDRFVHNTALSCVVHQNVGAITGSPTSTAVTTLLQHAPDNSTWTPYIPPDGTIAAQTGTAAAQNNDQVLNVDLSSAYRYIRPSTTVALAGGSSPAALVAVDLVLGGEQKLAAV